MADLTVGAWHVPPADDGTVGEPVAFETRTCRSTPRYAIGDEWGRRGQPRGSGSPATCRPTCRPRARRRPRLPRARRRLPGGGAGVGPTARREGAEPAQRLGSRGSGRARRAVRRGRGQPDVLASWQPTSSGDKRPRRAEPVYRLSPRPSSRSSRRYARWSPTSRCSTSRGQAGDDDARQVEILLALEAALDALDLTDVPAPPRTPRRAGRGARPAGVRRRPPRLGRRARAHRLGLAVARPRDRAQGDPHGRQRGEPARHRTDALVYAMSSAQQWEWVREHHPALFERVRSTREDGRFVPVGGMWVESDTNMVGGEAMARQFLVGQRWFASTSASRARRCGSRLLRLHRRAPADRRQAGCRWFLTQKISWNTTNVFPHHTFWWEGIDGTRVFTHFPPVDTYNAELTGRELAHAARNFRDKGAATRSWCRSGTATVAAARPAGCSARAAAPRPRRVSTVAVESPGVLRGRRGGVRRPRAGVGGRALPGDPPRHLHLAGRDEAGQPARRAPAARGRAVVGDGGRARPAGLSGQGAARGCGGSCCCTSSTTSSPARRSRGCTARRGRRTPTWSALERLVDAALDALAGDGLRGGVQRGPGRTGAAVQGLVGAARRGRRDVAGSEPSKPPRARERPPPRRARRGRRDPAVLDRAHGREVLPPGGAANLLQLHPDHPVKWDAWDLDRSYRARVPTSPTATSRSTATPSW